MDAGSLRALTLSDKLRLSASKGNLDEVAQCLQAGANFEPDEVNVLFFALCRTCMGISLWAAYI